MRVAKKKKHNSNEKAAQSQGSFNEHLVGRALHPRKCAALATYGSRALSHEAFSRMVACHRFCLLSLLWSYGEFLFFMVQSYQPSIDVKEANPNFVMTALILFFETQRAVGDGSSAVHADLPFSHGAWWF